MDPDRRRRRGRADRLPPRRRQHHRRPDPPTWDHLAGLLGRTDFLYVADSKLASSAAMGHIHSHGGRFVTVLPRSRTEDKHFRDWAQTHAPTWAEAIRLPCPANRHEGDGQDDTADRVYSTPPHRYPPPRATA